MVLVITTVVIVGAMYARTATEIAAGGFALLVAAIYGAGDYFGQRLEVSDDAIIDRRLFAFANIEIRRDTISSCRYRPIVLGSPPYFSALEIRSTSDRRVIAIRRYGWEKRRELFERLNAWIDASDVKLDNRTLAFLQKAAQ